MVMRSEAPTVPTHYDLLGVDPRSSRDEIDRAYRFHRDMYGEGALATYSLLDPDEIAVYRAQVDEAFRVLGHPEHRRAYDESLGIARGGAVVAFPTAKGEGGQDRPPRASVTDAPVVHGAARVVSSGAELRQAREARGISLRDISLRSKIGARFLEYIEQERFDMLPAKVYLRGFVAEYARAVGLDPIASAEAYLARVTRKS